MFGVLGDVSNNGRWRQPTGAGALPRADRGPPPHGAKKQQQRGVDELTNDAATVADTLACAALRQQTARVEVLEAELSAERDARTRSLP